MILRLEDPANHGIRETESVNVERALYSVRDAAYRVVVMASLLCAGGGFALAEDAIEQAPRPSPVHRVDYLSWLDGRRTASTGSNAAGTVFATAADLQPIEDRAALQRAGAGPWDDLPAVESWLKRHAHALRSYQDVARADSLYLGIKPATNPPGGPAWRGALIHAVVPGLATVRLAAEGHLAAGWNAWSRGDRDRIIENTLVNLRVARLLESERPMVARMASLNIAEHAHYALARAVSYSDDPVALAASLAARLVAADSPLSDMTDAYDFQRLTVWDFLQRLYAPPQTPGDRRIDESASAVYAHLTALVPGAAPAWEEVRTAAASTGFDADLADADAYFDRLGAWSAAPWHRALPRTGEVIQATEKLSNVMVRVFARDMTLPRAHHARAMTVQRGVHLLVHILEHRHRSGRYPQSLDELGSFRGIERWTIDPYTGKRFVYAPTREGFVLYSVGPDGKDDAARPFLPGTEAGDVVLWPAP